MTQNMMHKKFNVLLCVILIKCYFISYSQNIQIIIQIIKKSISHKRNKIHSL